MKTNKLFMYKIIISDNRGYHSPTHFAKNSIVNMVHYGNSILPQLRIYTYEIHTITQNEQQTFYPLYL